MVGTCLVTETHPGWRNILTTDLVHLTSAACPFPSSLITAGTRSLILMVEKDRRLRDRLVNITFPSVTHIL